MCTDTLFDAHCKILDYSRQCNCHTREASASCKLVHCPVGKCRLDNLIHSLPVYIIETGVPAYTTLGSEVIVIDRVLNVDEV